jgi:sugar phosphate isomerase/epimerase
MHPSCSTATMSADRRDFLRYAALSGAAAVSQYAHLPSAKGSGESAARPVSDRFCTFTESFQDWPIELVCQKFKTIGLDGLDLTVRPGGHIDPADVAKKLPAAAASAKRYGLRISMLTTAITDDNPTAERILATAGALGIDRIKLGYSRVQKFGALLSEIDQTRRRLERVARTARKHRVLPCVHVHSGDTIPASGAMAYLVLKDFPPVEVGAYVDPMHMTIEGGGDGWRQGLDLLAPWIALSSLKNFRWEQQSRDEHGQMRWRVVKCPLDDGMAPIPAYLDALRRLGYRGLYSLHSEYRDGNSWKRLSIDETLEQTARDLAYAKRHVIVQAR